jgi:hypothetical protein
MSHKILVVDDNHRIRTTYVFSKEHGMGDHVFDAIAPIRSLATNWAQWTVVGGFVNRRAHENNENYGVWVVLGTSC